MLDRGKKKNYGIFYPAIYEMVDFFGNFNTKMQWFMTNQKPFYH